MSKRAEWTLLLCIGLDLLGFGMIIAEFQLFAEKLVPKGWPVGPIVGALLASTFIVQLYASPRWGAWSDRTNRRVAFVTVNGISGLSMLIYAAAGNLWILLASRILSGLGAANVAIAQAYVTASSDPQERTAKLGRLSAAINTGLVLGPALGGFLSYRLGHGAVGVIAGVASLCGTAMAAIVLPNVTANSEAKSAPSRKTGNLALLREFPSVLPLVVVAAVAWVSLATLEGTFARLINRLYGLGTLEFGWIFSYESLLGIGISVVLLPILVKRLGELNLLRTAYICQGLGLVLNPFAAAFGLPPLILLFAASTVYSLGSSCANPTINGLASELLPEDRHGELFGLMQSARAFGFVVGPLVGGAMFDYWPPAPYVFAGIVCVIAAILVRIPAGTGKTQEKAAA
jgi:MFS family permease